MRSKVIKVSNQTLKAVLDFLTFSINKLGHALAAVDRWLCRHSSTYLQIQKKLNSYSYKKSIPLAVVTIIGGALLINTVASASNLNKVWDFSNPSDYTFNDNTSLENSGSATRLKAQNYASDSNTSALYHLDEASGSSVSDSSSNSNTGTAANSPTWGAANLNNGLTLNGSNQGINVPDSSSLSLSQSNSLESWTKFGSSFSANARETNQPVIDKGNYKLYYDHETGKPTYELENSSSNSWTQRAGDAINGSWLNFGSTTTSASVVMGGNLFVGNNAGGQIWKYTGSIWSQIGGDGLNVGWSSGVYDGVGSMATDGTNLFVGFNTGTGDGDVWKWNGTTWSQIGGDAINSSWAASTYETVSSMTYLSGNLYAGLGIGSGDGEVWKWNGSTWIKIGGDGLNSSFTVNTVSGLVNDGTNVYAGTWGSAGDGDVWKWNGTTWSQIGGDAINSSWAASTYEQITSVYYQGANLYVGTGSSTGDAEVWRWNGSTWSRLAYSGSTFAASTYEGVYSISGDGTNIYVGTGSNQNEADVFKYNGSTWSQIGNDGLNSGWTLGGTASSLVWYNSKLYAASTQSSSGDVFYSWDGTAWTREGGQYYKGSWGALGNTHIRNMTTVNGKLYAGLSGGSGSSVWEYNNSNWTLVGATGLNSSWTTTSTNLISSMFGMGGDLYVGLSGSQNGDGDVWKWDGSTWSQIGGNSINSSWDTTYISIRSLTTDGTNLYAGIGSSSTNRAEVWKWDGSAWTRIGGNGVGSSWANGTYRYVSSLVYYNGNLIAGTGSNGAGTADMWSYNGSSWSQIGGDGVRSSWNLGSSTNPEVESLVEYSSKLYASIVSSVTGDAGIWEYDGSTWSQMGGNGINSSWAANTYEGAFSLSEYNGDLYTGLGSTSGNGEVWKWNGTTWSQIGGDSMNSGWSNTIETVRSLQVYKGKLFAGLGDTQNGDAKIYSYGNNGYLQGSVTSQDTNWHHLAATYDGTTMKIYRDGSLIGSTSAALSMSDSSHELLIGQSSGSAGSGYAKPFFNGSLDEIRISNTARFNFTTTPYTSERVAVRLGAADYTSGVASWDGLSSSETSNGGTITYRLSDNNGSTWKYWNGSAWVESADLSQSNSISTINSNITSFPVTSGGIVWQAVLDGDGTQRVQLNSVTLAATADITPPAANASDIVMKRSPAGTTINDGAWTNSDEPYFSWTPANDTQSSIKGYCLYLGADNNADPVTTKGLLGTSPVTTNNQCQFMVNTSYVDLSESGYLASALTSSNSNYYLKIKALDSAGNIYNSGSASFSFKFDNTQPSNPLFVSTPSQFLSTKQVTTTWPTGDSNASNDAHSGVAGLQYKIGSSGTWYGDGHTGTQDSSDILVNDGSYQTIDPQDYENINDGNNTIYFRTYDNAGNVSTAYVTGVIKINTTSPTSPQNLTATPETNSLNSFAFSWQPPASYFGSAGNLTYCYTINATPSAGSCNFTAAGNTSLDASAYATQPGENTFYVVAKDEAGNINYATASQTTFTANTSAPGLALNMDVVDISVKSSSNWRLALSWDEPDDTGAGVANYKIYRSTDNSTFTNVASTAGTSYVDSGLSEVDYYYKIKACDSANNCGALTSSVTEKPTGKYTTAATITSQPKVNYISTRKATINWTTDRESDSRIQYGTKSGEYFSTEAAISAQVTDHEVLLNNLTAGTTYYAKAKWTDEDGNTGQTSEFTFKTAAAPVVKEVNSSTNLTGADIRFTSKDAAKIKLYYGKNEGFGGTQSLNTSLIESKYAMNINGLDDGTKYFFKLNTLDSDGNEYEGNVYSFTTPPRPRISNLRFQPVKDQPSSTQRVSWNTNVPASSELTYGIGRPSQTVTSAKLSTEHEIVIKGLSDDSNYVLVARSRDISGNTAISDQQSFKTDLDTRPPKITNVVIDTSIRGTGAEARGQVVVSWKTDEPASSQVAYGEGSSGLLSSVTSEDSKLSTEHVVVISDLSTSRVYHFEPRAFDKGRNESKGEQKVAIVGRASENVLSIIFNAIQKIFGVN